MKREFLAMVAVATLSSVSGALADQPAHGDYNDSVHKHPTCNTFVRHISSSHSGIFAAYASAAPAERLEMVKARIAKLDNSITDSLGKITDYQDQQFNDPQNSKKYEADIALERQNVNNNEERLSFALAKKNELEALVTKGKDQDQTADQNQTAKISAPADSSSPKLN